MNTLRILITEDEENLLSLIAKYLENEGFETLRAKNGDEALDFWYDEPFDLAILDVMMPGLSGWEVLEELRRESDIPVIMLTARREEEDRIRGFSLGTDDYITKPFSPRELVMRVRALLKRAGKLSQDTKAELPGISIDYEAKKVFTAQGEALLSAREFELLAYFTDNRGSALSRTQLLERIWGFDYDGDDRVLDTTIKRLRKKLGPCGECIKTLRGTGYRFEA